jgi:hypothetical protein
MHASEFSMIEMGFLKRELAKSTPGILSKETIPSLGEAGNALGTGQIEYIIGTRNKIGMRSVTIHRFDLDTEPYLSRRNTSSQCDQMDTFFTNSEKENIRVAFGPSFHSCFANLSRIGCVLSRKCGCNRLPSVFVRDPRRALRHSVEDRG